MPMRTLLITLVLLNLLALIGGSMGWLGTPATRGEPERLTNQLRPELIVLATETPQPPTSAAGTDPTESREAADAAAGKPQAPPPPADPQRCHAYSLTGQARVVEAENIARTLTDVGVARRTLEEPSHWRVRIPPAETREAAEQRARVLRNQGIVDMFVVNDDSPNRFSISLGTFSSAAHANQRLAQLRSLGINDASIAPGSLGQYRIEFRGTESTLATLIERLDSVLADSKRESCAR